MKAILTSIYCIPCLWTGLILLGTFAVNSYIMNSWVPFRGPLPSDGPIEGFASKAARIEFFDTNPVRIRTAFKFGIIGGVIWLAGLFSSLFILNYLNGAA